MNGHIFIGQFPLGQIVATQGVMARTTEEERISALIRHQNGDWGNVCEEDAESNNEALASGDRILSVYHTDKGVKFYIITESDRSYATFLLPEEY